MSPPADVAVVVFAREPAPGEAKTRLAPAIGPEAAADLYRCFLLDRFEQIQALPGVRRVVAFTPDDADLSALVPSGFELVPQGEGGLTERLVRVVERVGGPVILLDSDSPSLPPAYLREAVASLRNREADCVVGPADDGGYYLIGLASPVPSLFEGIPWSTPQVLHLTLERARAQGLSVRRLHAWWDVDVPEDLARLRASLHHAAWPPRTAEWLRELPAPKPPKDRRAAEDPETPWTCEGTRLVYANPWIRVREDRVHLPTGMYSPYGVIETSGAVGVLPFIDPETVLMVRQFRYVAGRATWEMPTGGIHPGEGLVEAANRELGEETGRSAGRLTPLGAFVSSKSVVDERAHIFLGEDLTEDRSAGRDPYEIVACEALPYTDVLGMVLEGEIEDAMTVFAVLRFELRRRGGP